MSNLKLTKQIPLNQDKINKIDSFISTELSNTFNDKTNEIINVFFSMINYERVGMADLIPMDEAIFLSNIMSANKYSCQISPKTFLIEHIKNAYLLKISNTSYNNIDKDLFLDKIESLSEYQCYILILLAFKSNEEKLHVENDNLAEIMKKNFLISRG